MVELLAVSASMRCPLPMWLVSKAGVVLRLSLSARTMNCVLVLIAMSTVTGGLDEWDESTWCAMVISVAGVPVTLVMMPSTSSPFSCSSSSTLVASLVPSDLVTPATSTMSPTFRSASLVMPSLNLVLLSVAKVTVLLPVSMVKVGALMAGTLPWTSSISSLSSSSSFSLGATVEEVTLNFGLTVADVTGVPCNVIELARSKSKLINSGVVPTVMLANVTFTVGEERVAHLGWRCTNDYNYFRIGNGERRAVVGSRGNVCHCERFERAGLVHKLDLARFGE